MFLTLDAFESRRAACFSRQTVLAATNHAQPLKNALLFAQTHPVLGLLSKVLDMPGEHYDALDQAV